VRRVCKEGKDSLDPEEQVVSFKSPRKTYKRAKPFTELDDFDADIVEQCTSSTIKVSTQHLLLF